MVNGIPKPDVGITWVSGGQDDDNGNTATTPQLFAHVNLTTLNSDGTERNDWDVGNNSTSTRLVTWKYTDDGFLEGFDSRDDPAFVSAKSDVAFTPEAGNTGFFYLAFANKNAAEHDTPMTYSVVVDGVVEGLEYFTTSGLTGLTDANGRFGHRLGVDISFKVGGVILGTATPEDIVSGKTFLQDIADVDRTDLNDEYLENMATFLQSLDENRNPDDGIVITDATRTLLQEADLDLRIATGEQVQMLVESIGARYVNEADAMTHVKNMLIKHTGLQEEDFGEHVSDSRSIEIFDYVVGEPGEAASQAVLGGDVTGMFVNATSETSTASTLVNSPFLLDSADTLDMDHDVWQQNFTLPADVEVASVVGL